MAFEELQHLVVLAALVAVAGVVAGGGQPLEGGRLDLLEGVAQVLAERQVVLVPTLVVHGTSDGLLPLSYAEQGLRRYGFHGTSHDLVTGIAAETLDIDRDAFNAVILHLGNGASATAIRGGKSVDTSMGYTPLAGLVMGTRSGDVDPSVITHLIRDHHYDAEQMDRVLNNESGLLGMSGNADMRQVLDSAHAGHRRARTAIKVASYRLAKYIGGYHVAVGGAQAIVFTAGIGENSAPFRATVLDRLEPLGVEYDAEKNLERSDAPRVISTEESAIPVLVVPTNEEMAIAQLTLKVAQQHGAL